MNEELKKRIAAINSGIVPEGYKKTKVGIVPVEWEIKTLGQVLKKVSNAVDVEPNTQYQEIGIRSHGKGIFYKEKVSGKELGNKSVFWIEPDCFVLNIVFAWEQAIGRTTKKEIGMIASHRFPMFKPNGIDIDYLVCFLLTKKGTTILELASPGGAGRNKTLGQDKFLNSKVILPPLPEQQKIAEILSTQDKLIELQEKKIEQLKKLKKAYLQKMFPKKGSKYPELRFQGFTDAWEQRKCSDVLTERNVQHPQSKEYPLVSFTVENGVTPKTERYEREQLVRGDKSAKKYKETRLNDIVYNPANLKFGAIARNKYGNAVFSPIYVTYEVKEELASPSFVEMCVTRDGFIKIALQYQQGTVYERMAVSTDDFATLDILLPTLDEQKKIGEYFANLDKFITLHQRKLDQEKQKKKALMQLLLTGKVRVKP